MKSTFRTTLALSGALLFGTSTFAQTKVPTLDVGTVTLNLGMARDKVLQQLREAGYNFIDLPLKDGESTVIVTRTDVDASDGRDVLKKAQIGVNRAMALVDNDGTLTFRVGSLIRIAKPIQSDFETDRELAASLYAIFRQHEKENSNHLCTLGTVEETPVPEVEAKQILITCGLGGGVYRTTIVQWSTAERLQNQLHVRVFQNLWR